MGDRCFMTVTVRKEQAEKFFKSLPRSWADSVEEDELTVTAEFQQANYGHGLELNHAADAGCEFYGQHDAGSNYEGAEFYSDGTEPVQYVYRGLDGCGVVVDGDTPQQRLENLRKIEERLSARAEIVRRLHHPLYDLSRESA